LKLKQAIAIQLAMLKRLGILLLVVFINGPGWAQPRTTDYYLDRTAYWVNQMKSK